MQMPVKGDKTYTIFDALVGSKLNVLAGCPSCPIAHTIIDAVQWMGAHPKDIKASSEAWQDETYFDCGSIPSG